MKKKSILIVSCVLLFSSCIVKSLQPFFTKDKIVFNEKLIGDWIDQKKGEWKIQTVKELFNKDRKEGVELSEEDKAFYETYKNGYLITYIKKGNEAQFIAVPFKIEDVYFINFIPFAYEEDTVNSLAVGHLLKTHSVTKLDINSDNEITFSWLSEARVGDLITEGKVRLKHEIVGPEKALLLTASSEELVTFLKKYLKADIEDKWNSSDKFTLTKSNAKP